MNTEENKPPQAHEIAPRALQLKALYLGTTLAIPALLDPSPPILQYILKYKSHSSCSWEDRKDWWRFRAVVSSFFLKLLRFLPLVLRA